MVLNSGTPILIQRGVKSTEENQNQHLSFSRLTEQDSNRSDKPENFQVTYAQPKLPVSCRDESHCKIKAHKNIIKL